MKKKARLTVAVAAAGISCALLACEPQERDAEDTYGGQYDASDKAGTGTGGTGAGTDTGAGRTGQTGQ